MSCKVIRNFVKDIFSQQSHISATIGSIVHVSQKIEILKSSHSNSLSIWNPFTNVQDPLKGVHSYDIARVKEGTFFLLCPVFY